MTVPKNKESANNVYNTVSGPLEGRGSTQTFRFEIPDLVVGTLDSLMALSDDLNKIGSQVEVGRRLIEIPPTTLFTDSIPCTECRSQD